jgi:hypothetical protein
MAREFEQPDFRAGEIKMYIRCFIVRTSIRYVGRGGSSSLDPLGTFATKKEAEDFRVEWLDWHANPTGAHYVAPCRYAPESVWVTQDSKPVSQYDLDNGLYPGYVLEESPGFRVGWVAPFIPRQPWEGGQGNRT